MIVRRTFIIGLIAIYYLNYRELQHICHIIIINENILDQDDFNLGSGQGHCQGHWKHKTLNKNIFKRRVSWKCLYDVTVVVK